MCENHSPAGKKGFYFSFPAQKVPEVTLRLWSFPLGESHCEFKSCYVHRANLSHRSSLCMRECTSALAQTKNQKSPSDQLSCRGTDCAHPRSQEKAKEEVTHSLTTNCHVCWQGQPLGRYPGLCSCTGRTGLLKDAAI